MKVLELIDAMGERLGTTSTSEIADVLGVTVTTLNNWKNLNKKLNPKQVASALVKSQKAAIEKAQIETIKPLVELYRIDKCKSSREAKWEVFDGGKEATLYVQGLKGTLVKSHGIYIFYDSRGEALYVGKARDQSLWREMNMAFNRNREVQTIKLVPHPMRNQAFQPGYEKLRQPKDTQLELYDLAYYFSAYRVTDGMIDDLESLMVRAFANNLLNVRMETFAHTKI